MRVVRLLLFLAFLILPLSLLADSVDYQGAGTLPTHTAFTRGSITAGHLWRVGVELREIDNLTTGKVESGSLGTLDVTSGTLFSCASGLCFTGGTLDIDGVSGKDLFFGALESGSITRKHGITIMSAILANGATTVIRDHGATFSTQALVSTGHAVIPEPASLWLMGTGLGLVGIAARKKKPCSGA